MKHNEFELDKAANNYADKKPKGYKIGCAFKDGALWMLHQLKEMKNDQLNPPSILQVAKEMFDPDKFGPFYEFKVDGNRLVLFHGSDDGDLNIEEPMHFPFWVTDDEGYEIQSFETLDELIRYIEYLIENPEVITDPFKDHFQS